MKRRVTQQDRRRDRHAMTHCYANEPQRTTVEFWMTPLDKQVRESNFGQVNYVKEVVT